MQHYFSDTKLAFIFLSLANSVIDFFIIFILMFELWEIVFISFSENV